jgi:ATP-dependent DNA ligase
MGAYYTIHGYVGGSLVRSTPTICESKNIGKKNSTSPYEQAVKEADALAKLKKHRGYSEDPDTSGVDYLVPLRANIYVPTMTHVFNNKTFVQPKLDGIRCISQNNTLFSRDGRPFVSCPHLHQDKYILDGELYNHRYKNDFGAIMSMITKQELSDEEFERTANLAEHHLYDMPMNAVFSERHSALLEAVDKLGIDGLVVVPTYEISTEEELLSYHQKFTNDGYEGTIIRVDGTPYKSGRCNQLLKYKDFIDEEYNIVDYIEGIGNRSGTIGKFVCVTASGVQFKCNVKGSHEYLRQVWSDVDSYVGTTATVKYKKLTPAKDGKGGVPSHGIIIKLNRESYE